MTNKQLLEIIACALKEEKYQKQIINEKEVLIQADENALVPLLFAGVDKNCFSKENYEKLKKKFFASVYNDTIQKTVIDQVNDSFNENKIEHIFLKGTHLKDIYQESYYRPMGDIDVLIKRENSSGSRKIMKDNGFIEYSRTAEHDVYTFEKYFVEVHREIYQKENKKDKSSFLRPWDYSVFVSDYRYRLDYTFEGAYLLYHLKKHVLSSGIGLRSILDIPIFFNHYEKEINREKLNQLLIENKMETFFQTILYINKKAFNLDCPFLDQEFSFEEEEYLEILNYITQSGTHGKGQGFNFMAPRVAKRGKIKTVCRLVFPKWDYMKESFPWLKYLPFLLPIAYVIRGFKFLFLKTKYTFNKLMKVKDSNVEAQELDDVFTKMGL